MENEGTSGKIQIWTIGHSNRTAEDFVNILKTHKIELLADVRSFPGSKRYPHFNKNSLDITLAQNFIEYLHIPELGGKRGPEGSANNTERAALKTYSRYMETDSFLKGINLLDNILLVKRTALMCAEARWRNCHRSLISDYLNMRKIEVIHIIDESRTEKHIYPNDPNLFTGEEKSTP
jgi:uncharacterized protein (DUF488 family)